MRPCRRMQFESDPSYKDVYLAASGAGKGKAESDDDEDDDNDDDDDRITLIFS